MGTVALALALGAAPAVTLADDDADVGVAVQLQGTAVGVTASTSVSGRGDRDSSERERGGRVSTTTVRENVDDVVEGPETELKEAKGLPFYLESSTTAALSIEQLKRSIEIRKHELEQEASSSSATDKEVVENANPVRLAVHTLLASKDLLGGIGSQVSVIARQMNDSIATTSSAEAKIVSRNFFTRLFFGGDAASGKAIEQAIAEDQKRIDELTKLLTQANLSADVQATINAQITAMKDAQARLQALATSEQKAWGLFSWRF